jgi:hypothetical protein
MSARLYGQRGQEKYELTRLCQRWMQLSMTACISQCVALDTQIQSGGASFPYQGFISQDAVDRRSAYVAPVLVALQGVRVFSVTQFRDNAIWLAPLLTSLVTSSYREIRMLVRDSLDACALPLIFRASVLLPKGAENSEDKA